MSDSYYRTERTWKTSDFPYSTNLNSLNKLGSVVPSGYEYIYVPLNGKYDLIELREHRGSGLEDD